MSRFGLIPLLVASALLATTAVADQNGKKGSHSLHCPPGLAKKNPPCIPPGRVNNSTAPNTVIILPETAPDPVLTVGDLVLFDPGDVLQGDYVVLVNPQVYNPNLDGIYVRFGDYLYLVSRDRSEVLDQLGPVSGWTWGWADTDFANCPPGLAKKNPPCVPPGLAKKGVTAQPDQPGWHADPYGLGDTLPEGYFTVLDPRLVTPNDNGYYVRQGDTLYRIDGLTGQVLDVIGDLANLLR
jgi:hypothetical protein